ncbi:hypothetical protein AMECASPLE_028905, partial [Ameca splendens]
CFGFTSETVAALGDFEEGFASCPAAHRCSGHLHICCKMQGFSFRRIGDTCSFPASSLITPHLHHLCSCLYIQLSDRQPVPDFRKLLYTSLASAFWTSDLASAS